MFRLLVVFSLLSTAAFAGKAEREFVKEKLNPAIAAAESAFKSKCGCGLKIKFDAGLKTEDELRLVRSMSNSIEEGVKYCTDAESKKAVCQMKSVELKLDKAKGTTFDFSGGRGLATTDGTSYPTFDMMTDKLDK